MKVYLDNCSFNRPFDSQAQLKVRLETEAKLFIQSKILSQEIQLVWSYMLEYENNFNPFTERKEVILEWRSLATEIIIETNQVLVNAKKLLTIGLKSKDAIHVACAMEAKCDYFITTDAGISRKLINFEHIKVINPIQFISIWEEER
ncbi:MAG: type II toxin-antitoxin system VapC family toxin [Bacteroidetes bacterium]|nr:type II toxin-antitoxin system VapC family toxin [Bacteroidota bacterium]